MHTSAMMCSWWMQLKSGGELADPPTEEEVVEAMGKLKERKAGGKNGILPEMVRGCGRTMIDYSLDVLRTVWMEQRVPQEWRHALLVPIPKKGDPTQCDKWRGISLLGVCRFWTILSTPSRTISLLGMLICVKKLILMVF